MEIIRKIALLINCINGSNYQSHFIQTGRLEQVTALEHLQGGRL